LSRQQSELDALAQGSDRQARLSAGRQAQVMRLHVKNLIMITLGCYTMVSSGIDTGRWSDLELYRAPPAASANSTAMSLFERNLLYLWEPPRVGSTTKTIFRTSLGCCCSVMYLTRTHQRPHIYTPGCCSMYMAPSHH
jgi:hypothetical protein